jgi:hypothetical protein
MVITSVTPQSFLDEHGRLLGYGFALLGFFAVIMLAIAAITAAREEPRGCG